MCQSPNCALMQGYELSYLDYYLPAESKRISELVEEVDQASIPSFFRTREDYLIFVETILELTHIRVENQLNEAQMLDPMITRMLESNNLAPTDIDLIIMTRDGNQDTRDNLGQFIQFHYKMTNAFVLNISGNHCANMAVAWNMVRTWSGLNNKIKNILVLNAFKTKQIDERIVGSYGLLSDGAGIMLLSKKAGLCRLKDSLVLSNGMLHKVDMNKDNSLMHLKYTTNSIKQLMTRNSVLAADICQVVPQNANIILISNAVMESGIPVQKIFTDNISRCGHIDSVDFIINLKDILDNNRFKRDDLLLMLNIGWAGSYVSSLIAVN